MLTRSQSTSVRRRATRGLAGAALSIALALGLLSPSAAGATDRTNPSVQITTNVAAQTATTPFNAKILSARAGLTTAVAHLARHWDAAAVTALRDLRVRLSKAHLMTMSLMGPGRVLSMLNIEHQVAMELLPPFNGLTRSTVLTAVQAALQTSLAERTWLLNKVVALPQDEGVGSEYDDGEADTLPLYTTEETAYASALGQYRLTVQGKTALTKDLGQVHATAAQFTRRFGGGE
jgi:hypothetical protein